MAEKYVFVCRDVIYIIKKSLGRGFFISVSLDNMFRKMLSVSKVEEYIKPKGYEYEKCRIHSNKIKKNIFMT